MVSASMSDQLGAGHLGEVVEVARRRARWTAPCGAGRRRSARPRSTCARSGAGCQTARATGSFGSGCVGRDDVDLVGDSRNRSPRSAMPSDDGRARGRRRRPAGPGPPGRRCRAGGSRSARPCRRRCDGQTSSMCAPRIFSSPGHQVVGVVLHEATCRRAARRPSTLSVAQQRPRSSSRPRRRSRSRRPSAAARRGRAAGAARRGPRSSW